MAAARGCIATGKLFKFCLTSSMNYQGIRNGSFSKSREKVLRALYKRKQEMGPEEPQHRNQFYEWNHKAELYAFSKRVGEEFKGDTLLTAFTQRSHVIFEEERQRELGVEDLQGSLSDNQHLEKEGIKLMSRVIPKYLRAALPCLPEEAIRAMYDYLRSEENLAHVASNIGAEELILCTDFPVEKKTLASTMCSLIGAVAESNGQNRAALFVRDFVIARLSGQEVNNFWVPENAMMALSDILKRDGRSAPEARIISQFGTETILKSYRVGMYCDKQFIGAGDGETVDTAVEQAALDALWRLWGTREGKLQFPFRLDIASVMGNKLSSISIGDWSIQKVEHNIALAKNFQN